MKHSETECVKIGREAVKVVRDALQSVGITARIMPENDPFDILVCASCSDRPTAGLEVKYVGLSSPGTHIYKRAKLRKIAYAHKHGFTDTFTVAVRPSGMIVWLPGLRNAHISVFERDFNRFAETLRGDRVGP